MGTLVGNVEREPRTDVLKERHEENQYNHLGPNPLAERSKGMKVMLT